MKYILLIVLGSLASGVAAQSIRVDSLFIVTYTTGEGWDPTKKPNEQPWFKEHGARLGQLRKEGIIRLGGRYADKGMIVISASDYSAAKEIIWADVAVQNKLFNADVQRLNVFYDGCLERKK